ncbi:glucan phosphoethanolaminetransferase (alkaline phosphatase superfamily) [Methanomicrobium sp. W14]|uniref:hypothetical protein n=1 Tax=Methanomicrobium sp. W14 TaxID=2817839 RepID=UPI001AE92B0A|nr:hypothetical protein [Methanomicrobium sp. W14]MBP2134327.1 glucan phosphoethanolaminetransferase (alkaline phosphatase superfamily) [Methanomicrobium sp. W14]
MNFQKTAKSLDKVLYVLLLLILLLNSLMYLFAFTLNWETWFLGMKTDGLIAGIILFAYFFIPAALCVLLLMYPQSIVAIALLSVFFFCFGFIDSSMTVQKLSGGLNLYNEFMAVFMVIPLIVLAGHLAVTRLYSSDEDSHKNEMK